MSSEVDPLKETAIRLFANLEVHYCKLSLDQKRQVVKNITNSIVKDPKSLKLLTIIRRERPNQDFGKSILIDVTYSVFPDMQAA